LNIAQSHSILRFVGRLHGQYGDLTSPEEAARVDQLADSTEDLRKKLMAIKYGAGTEEDKRSQYVSYHNEVYPIWIKYFENLHVRFLMQKGPFIAGTQNPTFADFLLYDLVDTHRLLVAPALKSLENDGRNTYDPFVGVPALRQWHEKVSARPQLRDYLESGRRREH